MKPQFQLLHYRRPSRSNDVNQGTCFTCARLLDFVSIGDSKHDSHFGQECDVRLTFSADAFDAFLADVRAAGSLGTFLARVASGALTQHCFTTGFAPQEQYPYAFSSIEEPGAGVLRYSEAEMDKLYHSVLDGDFVADTVPECDRHLVLA